MDIHNIRVTTPYKSPVEALHTDDLNKLTTQSDFFVIEGDFNTKHPMWNSRCSNPAGNILYNHARNASYTVLAPDTPTFFPVVPGHRPDVIDIKS